MLTSRCISVGPLSIVVYVFLALAVLGFLGLLLLHICRKLGLTRKLKRWYADDFDGFELQHVIGGRVELGTSSFNGGERWIDLEMRARFYSPVPAPYAGAIRGCGKAFEWIVPSCDGTGRPLESMVGGEDGQALRHVRASSRLRFDMPQPEPSSEGREGGRAPGQEYLPSKCAPFSSADCRNDDIPYLDLGPPAMAIRVASHIGASPARLTYRHNSVDHLGYLR